MSRKSIYRSIALVTCLTGVLLILAFRPNDRSEKISLPEKPNIIIILTDDQGYGDVGFNGCRDIATPNIDRIAKNGARFTNGYVSYSVCAPSRAGLITGRYQDRFGYSRNPLYRPSDSQIVLPLTEQTLPELLKQAGYKTMGIGKWHLGVHEKFRPWNRGFDEYFGFLGGGHRYFPEDYTIANTDSARNELQSYRTKLIRNQQVVEETEYLTDALSREAVSFIERNKKDPFFLYLAYNAPHAPLQASEKYLNRYNHIPDPKRKTYAAMVSAVDDGVGAVLDKLEQLNLARNTIVVFLSDNGGPEHDNGSDNGELRGTKGTLYEGGIRVPFAIQWPGKIPASKVYQESVISLDIFATLRAHAAPEVPLKNPLDGVDLLPYINGTVQGAPHQNLFWRQYDRKDYAVIGSDGMKSLTLNDTGRHLYNLRTDIGEKNDLLSAQRNAAADLQKHLQGWLSETVPPLFYGLNQEALYEAEKKRAQVPSKPNIIIMLLDDAGYADFGFIGTKDLLTPNIDRLAADAVRFTDAHVSASVCSPSRAGLLTGRYQQRFGYECNEGDGYSGLDPAQVLLPEYLAKAGYATAAFGKWHLGFRPEQHPLKKGFQYYYGFLSGGRSYFYNEDKDDQPGSHRALVENNRQVRFNGYLTDVLGDKAVEYIRQHRNNPFFMYWAPNAVHTPMEAREEDLKKFEGQPRQQLAAMTFALDRSIGKIINELKKQGIYENTLVFFLSDNGGAANNQSNNLPLKGFKGNEYEAGHRVPFLVSWPGKFKPGSVFNGLSSSLDIFSTALDAGGIPHTPSQGLDGVSLLPFLRGEQAGNPHRELIWRKDFAAAIRFNDLKLVRVQGLGERLYNLKNDPGETRDLLAEDKTMGGQLRKQLMTWEKNMMKPLWTEGATWDTITLMIHDDLMRNREVRVKDPQQLKLYKESN